MPKRCKERATRYKFDQDNDDVAADADTVVVPHIHRHVDYSYGASTRPSTQTAYLQLEETVAKRPRSDLQPTPGVTRAENISATDFMDGVDLDYMYRHMGLTVEESRVRRPLEPSVSSSAVVVEPS